MGIEPALELGPDLLTAVRVETGRGCSGAGESGQDTEAESDCGKYRYYA